jgi:predicted ATPase
MGDAEIGHHETAGQFDNDLVHRVLRRTEAPGEIAVQTMFCARRVSGLVTGQL